MAAARLPVILVLVLYLLKDPAQGQQLVLQMQNNPNGALSNNPAAASHPKIANLIASAKNSQNCAKESIFTIRPKAKSQLTGLQKFLSLQQPRNPTANLQQPLTWNIQSALGNQQAVSLQQPIDAQQCQYANKNLQQSLNVQPSVNHQQCLNLQQQISSETLQQPLNLNLQDYQQTSNLQQVVQQQPNTNIHVNNLQCIEQQASIQNQHSLPSLPMINGQIQGLPSQVSQGLLLSSLGLNSKLPSLLSCSKPPSDQSSMIYSQNSDITHSNAQTPMCDRSHTTNFLPMQLSPTYFTDECITNNANSLTSFSIPVNSQNFVPNQQSQFLDYPIQIQYQHGPNPEQNLQSQLIQTKPIPAQYVQDQPALTQIIPTKSTPIHPEQVQPAIQNQLIPNHQIQPLDCPIQTQYQHDPNPVQNLQTQLIQTKSIPAQCVQVQPALTTPLQSTPIQPEQVQPTIQNQPSLPSFLLSQIQPANLNPSQYSNSGSYPTNSGYRSKSSSMKSLLPLLFNLLKEKNGGCGCPPNCNCNCGCMHQYPGWNSCMNNNNYNSNGQGPQMRNIISSNANVTNDDTPENKENINNNMIQKAEVIDGYSNKIIYGREKDNITNSIESEENEFSMKVQDKQKYQNYKKMKDESVEEYEIDDDYSDSYENED